MESKALGYLQPVPDTMTLMCFFLNLSFNKYMYYNIIKFIGTKFDYEEKIQELQEQLKAEQKIKKKVVQELDALQKRQNRHGVESKVHFSYLQPVSGTIALHHCNNM